jgi:hypothetical protein
MSRAEISFARGRLAEGRASRIDKMSYDVGELWIFLERQADDQ